MTLYIYTMWQMGSVKSAGDRVTCQRSGDGKFSMRDFESPPIINRLKNNIF